MVAEIDLIRVPVQEGTDDLVPEIILPTLHTDLVETNGRRGNSVGCIGLSVRGQEMNQAMRRSLADYGTPIGADIEENVPLGRNRQAEQRLNGFPAPNRIVCVF